MRTEHDETAVSTDEARIAFGPGGSVRIGLRDHGSTKLPGPVWSGVDSPEQPKWEEENPSDQPANPIDPLALLVVRDKPATNLRHSRHAVPSDKIRAYPSVPQYIAPGADRGRS